MDQTDNDTTTIGYYLDRRREWGAAGFDRTRTLTLDYVYQLPDFVKDNGFAKVVANGWEVSGVMRFWDGVPINITSNGNAGVLSGGGIRANYLGGSPYATDDVRSQLAAAKLSHPELLYINPLVFARPADGSVGNMGRNNLRGPGINQWDFSIFKNFQFGEQVKAQLRLETFNIFNHTQFVNPGSLNVAASNAGQALSIGAGNIGTFGQFTDTRDPRNVQLGLKISF